MKITYIHHSSFSAELEKCILLFDYFKGKLPKFDINKSNIITFTQKAFIQVFVTGWLDLVESHQSQKKKMEHLMVFHPFIDVPADDFVHRHGFDLLFAAVRHRGPAAHRGAAGASSGRNDRHGLYQCRHALCDGFRPALGDRAVAHGLCLDRHAGFGAGAAQQ